MKKKMFLIAMAIVVPFLLICIVLGGLVGGNTEVVPADEETAMKYQMCASQLGVDWFMGDADRHVHSRPGAY